MLAVILEAPAQGIVEHVRETMKVLELINWDAKRHLDNFHEFCLANPLDSLREIHTRTFDSGPRCSPFVGCHLFSDDRSRKLFVAKLREHYGAHVPNRKEPLDHIAVMLRSLVVQESVEEARELISYCMIPAVKKMIPLLQDGVNPYREVLQAVLLTLETEDRNPRSTRQEDYALAGVHEKKRDE